MRSNNKGKPLSSIIKDPQALIKSLKEYKKIVSEQGDKIKL